MKLSFTVANRVALQTALPDRDSFENLCIRKEILDKTAFTSDEVELNKIETKEISGVSTLSWIETTEKEFEINAISLAYIQNSLKKISEAKELTLLQFDLYKKIHSV